MTIEGIVASKSEKGKLVFRTNPPLTKEIFERFIDVWDVEGFSHESGCLVWNGASVVDRSFVEQTAIYLTEAENKLKAEETRARRERIDYLTQVANQTGLKLL